MSRFLIHRPGDSVGVATEDLAAGAQAAGRYRDEKDGTGETALDVIDPVPLGHKIALSDLNSGQEVIEYGVAIGVATQDVQAGQHVHTHNLKGQRWA